MMQTESSMTAPVAEARRLYRRVVSAWASESLELRRLGLDRPGSNHGGAAVPSEGSGLDPHDRGAMLPGWSKPSGRAA